ncbi:MAG TPA: hypothetical protein VNQ99_07220 [Xanthobacteraceae bacterium]|nr:hypothetical protein [Xanthobacteraceae bacterium]
MDILSLEGVARPACACDVHLNAQRDIISLCGAQRRRQGRVQAQRLACID